MNGTLEKLGQARHKNSNADRVNFQKKASKSLNSIETFHNLISTVPKVVCVLVKENKSPWCGNLAPHWRSRVHESIGQ